VGLSQDLLLGQWFGTKATHHEGHRTRALLSYVSIGGGLAGVGFLCCVCFLQLKVLLVVVYEDGTEVFLHLLFFVVHFFEVIVHAPLSEECVILIVFYLLLLLVF